MRESLAFSLRYVVITLSWVIRWLGLVWLLGNLGVEVSQLGMNPATVPSSGLIGIVTVCLVVVAFFAPTLGFLICTATESVPEVLGIGTWRELISNHKADLVVFYASMSGGVITFWILYFFPFVVTAILAFYLDEGLGATVTGFIFALPVLMAPILLGRICGAFVYALSNQEAGEFDSGTIGTPTVDSASTATAPPGAQAFQSSPDTAISHASVQTESTMDNQANAEAAESTAGNQDKAEVAKSTMGFQTNSEATESTQKPRGISFNLDSLSKGAGRFQTSAGCYQAAGSLTVEVLEGMLNDTREKGSENDAKWIANLLAKKILRFATC